MDIAHTCTLLDAPAGTRVRVCGLAGQGGMRSRLYALGITPGTEVEVCEECSCHGSRRIKVRDAALVLCASVAQSVLCECAPQEGDSQRVTPEPCRGVCAEGDAALTVCCDAGCKTNGQPAHGTCKGMGGHHAHRGQTNHQGRHGGERRRSNR